MRTKNKKRLSRKLIALIVVGSVVILGLAGAGTYLVAMNGTLFGWTPFPAATDKDSDVDYGPPTEEETGTGNDIKEEEVSPDESDQKPGTTPEQPIDTGSTVIMSIPYAEQQQAGGDLRVTTLIEKVTSSGTCTLTLSRAGYESTVMTADVQAQSSSSTCKGFTIPTTTMAKGNWNLRIDYKNGDVTGSVSKDQVII
jgi:hypothetical protein